MTVASFDASEWNEFAADLGKAPARMVKQGNKILHKVIADGTREAQAFAPVDTGNMRSGTTGEVRGLEGEFGPTAEYAPYVEDGTSRMAPQAFVGPAFDRQQPGFVTAVQALTEVIL
jgi:HK97 gp10 family phage protein